MKKASRKDLILRGDMYRALMVLSFPIMINNLIQTMYNLADGVWVARLGHVQFAATSFVWPVNFLFISLGFGLSIAATSILSQLVGADRIEEANDYSAQIISVSMIFALIFTLIGYLATPTIIRWMGATGDLKRYSITYLQLTFLDMPFMFLFYNINSIMTAEGDTLTPTILSGISAIMNVILDPIFIFTFDMGIAGAAIATIISRAALAIGGIIYLKYKDTLIRPNFKNFKFNRNKLENIVQVALPSSIGQSGSALGFIVLNGFIASFGTATMAAYGMVNRITSLAMQPAAGIGAALTSIIGQNMGAGQLERAKDGFKKAVKFVLIIGIIGCGIMLVFDKPIIHFFMQTKDEPAVIEQGLEYLRYSALFIPLMGLFNVFQGVFQGSGHTKYSMYMEVGRLWFVRLPMILIFKNYTNLGPTGIWIAMSVSNLIVCVYGYILYRQGKWENNVVRRRPV